MERQLADEVAVGVTNIIVIRLVVMLRPMHRNIAHFALGTETHSWLQCLEPRKAFDDIVTGNTLSSGSSYRVLCEIRLTACWTCRTVEPLFPSCIGVLTGKFSNISAYIHLAVSDDLSARSILCDRHLKVTSQLKGFSSSHSSDIRNKFNCIDRETVLWQDIVPDEEADQALLASIVFFAAAEVPEITTPCTCCLIVFATSTRSKFLFHFSNSSTEILNSNIQHTAIPTQALNPAEIINSKATMHIGRDGPSQKSLELFGLSGKIIFEPLVSAFVEKNSLVISGVHIIMC